MTDPTHCSGDLPGVMPPNHSANMAGANGVAEPVNMLTAPRCRAEQLGLPMPDSRHAVSACLPLWDHNIGYEEGRNDVVDRLQAAYPRFKLHPLVRDLCRQSLAGTTRPGLVFPSRAAAQRAIAYVRSRFPHAGELVPISGQDACGVAVEPSQFHTFYQYWQHAGEIVSSRAAEQILAGQRVTYSATTERTTVTQRFADSIGTEVGNIRLYPSGMAAIAAAWRAIRSTDPVNPSVQFGFPYVDTLKIQQRFQPAAYRFFPGGSDAELQQLQEQLASSKICAVFCEAPSNPLLTCPDLHELRRLADLHGFVLVVDDTLAACVNLNVLPLADMVVTSLTKYFSGYGDVLAGSVTLNPASRHFATLKSALDAEYEPLLSDIDAAVLERNSRDFTDRIDIINSNARTIAARLAAHSAVSRVCHPSILQQPTYEALRRPGGGDGGLLSIVLHDAPKHTPAVFDALSVCKGPNLGTYFTLCCPFTILAHFDELDFVEQFGVSRWLLRISVGTEPLEELWRRFETALRMAN